MKKSFASPVFGWREGDWRVRGEGEKGAVLAQRSCEARQLDGIGMGVSLSKKDQINMCGLYCGRGRDVVILTPCKGEMNEHKHII